MRLKVTLLLLLASFLQKEFCLASFDNCDIKITNFNTYEITCPKPNPKDVKVSKNDTESSDESTTETVAGNLCCRLHNNIATSGTTIADVETNAWLSGQSECEPFKSTSSTWGEVRQYTDMVEDTSTKGNTCKVTLKSEIKDSEGMDEL